METVHQKNVDREKTAWERVQISRAKDRPSGSDYIHALFTDFTEQRGDRCYGDDRAIIGGVARFHGIPVTVIAQEKGRTTKENIEHNFWNAITGRVQKGSSTDETGRKVSTASNLFCGYTGSILWFGSGRERTGRSYCTQFV